MRCRGARPESHGFLELVQRVIQPSLTEQRMTQIGVRSIIVPGRLNRMPEQGFAVPPVTRVVPGQGDANQDYAGNRKRCRHNLVTPPPGQVVCGPGQENQYAY